MTRISHWGLLFDLTDIMHAMYTDDLVRRRQAQESAAAADYRVAVLQSLNLDTRTLDKLDWAAGMILFNQLLGKVSLERQNKACQDFVAARWSWLPRTQQLLSQPGTCKGLRLHAQALCGESCESGFPPVLLSKELREERLDARESCRVMMSCIAQRLELLGRNRTRLTSGSVPGRSEADLADLGFMLGSISSTTGMLRLFGINPKTHGRCPLTLPGLPRFFAPAVTDSGEIGTISTLEENAGIVLDLLDVRRSRSCMLCFDETVFFGCHEILREGDVRSYVGGHGDKVRVQVGTVDPRTLQKKDIANVFVTYLLHLAARIWHPCFVLVGGGGGGCRSDSVQGSGIRKRTDTNKSTYSIPLGAAKTGRHLH